eukprot:s403_g25.t1
MVDDIYDKVPKILVCVKDSTSTNQLERIRKAVLQTAKTLGDELTTVSLERKEIRCRKPQRYPKQRPTRPQFFEAFPRGDQPRYRLFSKIVN